VQKRGKTAQDTKAGWTQNVLQKVLQSHQSHTNPVCCKTCAICTQGVTLLRFSTLNQSNILHDYSQTDLQLPAPPYIVEEVAVIHCMNVEDAVVRPQFRGEEALDAARRLLLWPRDLWGGLRLSIRLPPAVDGLQQPEQPLLVFQARDTILAVVLLYKQTMSKRLPDETDLVGHKLVSLTGVGRLVGTTWFLNQCL
jgi:hypothetical protein